MRIFALMAILFCLSFAAKAQAQEPIDLANIIENSKLIYVGEAHDKCDSKVFLGRRMADMKKLGVTHLGFEMVESADQRVLDAYEAGGSEQLISQLMDKWLYEKSGYLAVMRLARENGIKLVALDATRSKTNGEYSVKRDNHMAKIIAARLASSANARMFVLIGDRHIERGLKRDDYYSPYWVQYQPGILAKRYRIASRTVWPTVSRDLKVTEVRKFPSVTAYPHDVETDEPLIPSDDSDYGCDKLGIVF